MPDFGIFGPKLGLMDTMPSVLLDSAFLAEDTRNVHEIDGLYKHLPGRLISLTDLDGVQIATPKFVYAVTAVSTGSKQFTISGNHASDFTSLTTVRVNGSTDNDKLYTLVSANDSGVNTLIVVSEALTSATVDGNIFVDAVGVMAYHTHNRDSTGVDYLLVATAYHIFQWNYTNKYLEVKFTSGTPANVVHWGFASLANQVYATNNVEVVQVYDIGTSPSGTFGALENSAGLDIGGSNRLTDAKYMTVYEGYLVLGATTEAGTYHPRRVRWSDASDTTEWDATLGTKDTGFRDSEETPGDVVGLSVAGNILVVAKQDQIILGRLNTSTTVFDWDANSIKRGVAGPGAMVDIRGRFFFIGDDRLVHELTTEDPVIPQANKTSLTISKCEVAKAKAVYIEEYNQVWFAVPVGNASANNLVIAYDTDTGKAYYHDMAIDAFGMYTQQEVYTYATLPYSTFSEWGAAWLFSYNSPNNALGTVLDLAGHSDGKTSELKRSDTDNGAVFTSTMDIQTSLASAPSINRFKRASDRVELWVNGIGEGTVTLSAILDGSTTVQALGSRSMVLTGKDYVNLKFPCDLRFKSCVFRVTSTAMIEFIGLLVINFNEDGID